MAHVVRIFKTVGPFEGKTVTLGGCQFIDGKYRFEGSEREAENLGRYLRSEPSEARDAYVALRRFLVQVLMGIRESAQQREVQASAAEAEAIVGRWLSPLDEQAADFDLRFRARLVEALRQHHLDGMALSSLVNDLGYANGIVRGLRNVLALAQGHEVLRALWRQAGPDAGQP